MRVGRIELAGDALVALLTDGWSASRGFGSFCPYQGRVLPNRSAASAFALRMQRVHHGEVIALPDAAVLELKCTQQAEGCYLRFGFVVSRGTSLVCLCGVNSTKWNTEFLSQHLNRETRPTRPRLALSIAGIKGKPIVIGSSGRRSV